MLHRTLSWSVTLAAALVAYLWGGPTPLSAASPSVASIGACPS